MENYNTGKVAKRQLRKKFLYSIIFKRVFLVSLLIILIALGFVIYYFAQNFISEIGKSRMDVLRQISVMNQTIQNFTKGVVDQLYTNITTETAESHITKKELEAIIKDNLQKSQSELNEFKMDSSLDVILNNKMYYHSLKGNKRSLQDILNSYWYTRLVTGETDRNWNIRFLSVGVSSSVIISYGRVFRDDQGKIIGVIIGNTSQSMVYKNYSKVLNNSNRIYVVDENGLIISHSNVGLIGFSLYSVGFLNRRFKKTSGSFLWDGYDGKKLVTNYYDPITKWITIEELQVSSIIKSYEPILIISICVILGGIMLALFVSYITVRTITSPLTYLSRQMERMQDGKFVAIDIRDDYYEVQKLTSIFNALISRICKLIDDIKKGEAEKRKIEFNFLQAQINPHFLHNTLLTIKSLIMMEQSDKAEQMLNAFIKLLTMPINAQRKSNTLDEEIEYVKSYVQIMECRYGHPFQLVVEVDDQLHDFLVPQVLLQPIVENAIFHGLADVEYKGCITIRAYKEYDKTIISIDDNGEGMPPEKLKKIWDETSFKTQKSFNNIGLKNVKSRIMYFFGPQAYLQIESKLGEGTKVKIII